ncbi:MAG: energy transducer TonB [Alistipes finegoldii]
MTETMPLSRPKIPPPVRRPRQLPGMGAEKRKVPAEAFEKGIGGRVVLSFVVEKDGSVSDIEKLQAPDASLWEEARRVIASSPKWKPGEQRGQIVRVKYTLPVDFRLTKASDTPAPESESSFQPATTKQTARRHNPDSPNRPARIPESTGSTNRPPGLLSPASSRGPASAPDFARRQSSETAPAPKPQNRP